MIKVRAVSINGSDREALIGAPLYARLGELRRPGQQILGSDIAGHVEMAGRDVQEFQPGDEVFGAEVTGVDNTDKMEFLRSLGADHVM